MPYKRNTPRRKKLKTKYKKRLISVLLVLAAFLGVYLIVGTRTEAPTDNSAGIPGDEEIREEPPEYREALLIAVGDIMVHSSQIYGALTSQGGIYDFSPSFEFISGYISEADLAVGNLETTFAGRDRGYSGYPLFNSPDELAQNLKDAGFDLICTANNHSLDRGESGLYRTIEILEKAGLRSFGTARTPRERDDVLIVDVNGINIAFLAYTDSTNGMPIPAGKDYIINYIPLDADPQLNTAREYFNRDIARAREAGADLVAVYMHWGWEYRFNQNDWQMRLAQLLAEAGADMVLGSHPHVIQPMEYITVKNDDGSYHRTFVAYSMGNFISNQFHWPPHIPTEEVKYGLVLRIHLEKEMVSGDAYINDVDYLITWVNRDWRHRVMPLHEIINASPSEYNIPGHKHNRLLPVWNNTVNRLEGFEPAFTP